MHEDCTSSVLAVLQQVYEQPSKQPSSQARKDIYKGMCVQPRTTRKSSSRHPHTILNGFIQIGARSFCRHTQPPPEQHATVRHSNARDAWWWCLRVCPCRYRCKRCYYCYPKAQGKKKGGHEQRCCCHSTNSFKCDRSHPHRQGKWPGGPDCCMHQNKTAQGNNSKPTTITNQGDDMPLLNQMPYMRLCTAAAATLVFGGSPKTASSSHGLSGGAAVTDAVSNRVKQCPKICHSLPSPLYMHIG